MFKKSKPTPVGTEPELSGRCRGAEDAFRPAAFERLPPDSSMGALSYHTGEHTPFCYPAKCETL